VTDLKLLPAAVQDGCQRRLRCSRDEARASLVAVDGEEYAPELTGLVGGEPAHRRPAGRR